MANDKDINTSTQNIEQKSNDSSNDKDQLMDVNNKNGDVTISASKSVDTKRLPISKEVCGYCNKKCTKSGKNSECLLCDYCERWYHARCEGMTSDVFKSFSNLCNSIPNMSYYCEFNQCKRVSSEILRQLGPIKTKVIENEQRINKLESNLNMINDNIDNKVEQIFRDQTSQGIKDEVKKLFDDEKDRTYRENNLIIANFSESFAGSSGNTGGDRGAKEALKTAIENYFRNHLGIDNSAFIIRDCYRLGKIDNSKPRLIRVRFADKSEVVAILRAYNDKNTNRSNDNTNRINIMKDLSQKDRLKRKNLVQSMKEKNSNKKESDCHWKIRGDKLIYVNSSGTEVPFRE